MGGRQGGRREVTASSSCSPSSFSSDLDLVVLVVLLLLLLLSLFPSSCSSSSFSPSPSSSSHPILLCLLLLIIHISSSTLSPNGLTRFCILLLLLLCLGEALGAGDNTQESAGASMPASKSEGGIDRHVHETMKYANLLQSNNVRINIRVCWTHDRPMS